MIAIPDVRSLRIAVLLGGISSEREVSLVTGAQVAHALTARGALVETFDTADLGFIDALRSGGFDVAFICLHGRLGEDGTMQGLLEVLGIPYVGSGVLASALAMDKVMSKRVFASHGIPTPPFMVVHRGEPVEVESVVATLGERSVVKPVSEGSAIGVSIVHEPGELPAAIEEAFRYDATALIEGFIEGVEVTVGVLGNDEPIALPTL